MLPDQDAPVTRRELKAELADLKSELKTEFADFKTELKAEFAIFRKEVGEDIARSAQAMMEYMRDLFRVATDHTKAVGDRLDEHIADATVHRVPRRRAR
jgi:hypothetical protein